MDRLHRRIYDARGMREQCVVGLRPKEGIRTGGPECVVRALKMSDFPHTHELLVTDCVVLSSQGCRMLSVCVVVHSRENPYNGTG